MEAHAPRLHALAARMLGDPALAEDVVQATFLKAWQKAEAWVPGSAPFAAWLRRVTVNACLDQLRRRGHPAAPVAGVEVPERTDPAPPADAVLERGERAAEVRRAVDGLPARQKAALALFLDGASQREGADALGVSEGAYESLLVRARRTLRGTLRQPPHPTTCTAMEAGNAL